MFVVNNFFPIQSFLSLKRFKLKVNKNYLFIFNAIKSDSKHYCKIIPVFEAIKQKIVFLLIALNWMMKEYDFLLKSQHHL